MIMIVSIGADHRLRITALYFCHNILYSLLVAGYFHLKYRDTLWLTQFKVTQFKTYSIWRTNKKKRDSELKK